MVESYNIFRLALLRRDVNLDMDRGGILAGTYKGTHIRINPCGSWIKEDPHGAALAIAEELGAC